MKVRTAGFLVLAALMATAASAHHNMSALFDFNDRVTLTGTLTKMDWRNPHIYLLVDAKRGTGTAEWSLEGPAPNFFRTREITKADIEMAIGKMVTAEVSRARNGSHSGLIRSMTLPDGRVVSACPQNC